ncbi:MAG TPA: prepilin-type N-terminal cleavage/methylation domain-containing protein [Acidobacteriota bacterium]|nr:prepilin-type N-terminal cleavage/methylation domain-containing protein [Acidobacteriota bacterium]
MRFEVVGRPPLGCGSTRRHCADCHRPSAGGSQRGFTLIEMVVAVTLVAMMAVGLWAALRVSVLSWSRGTDFIDANQRNRTIMDMIQKQLASICGLIAPIDPQIGGGIYPIFAGAETSVQFISLNPLRFQENPGLTMVSYDVIHDRAGNYTLMEREERYLGLDPSRQSFLDRREEQATPLFSNLLTFKFEYFDPGTADQQPRWVTNWDAQETKRLPAAISMTMVSRDLKGGTFSRQIVVPIMAKPSDPRLTFVNPFESRPPRLGLNDPRMPR